MPRAVDTPDEPIRSRMVLAGGSPSRETSMMMVPGATSEFSGSSENFVFRVVASAHTKLN